MSYVCFRLIYNPTVTVVCVTNVARTMLTYEQREKPARDNEMAQREKRVRALDVSATEQTNNCVEK